MPYIQGCRHGGGNVAERGFDDAQGQLRDPGAGGPPAAPFSGTSFGPPSAAGPIGDWLQEAHNGWPAPAAPPSIPWPAGPTRGSPGPWVAPPPMEREESRSRWTASGLAPWVVAGLLCAYLLTGRGPAAPPPPTEPETFPSAAVAPQPVQTAAAGLEPVTSCPGVAP